MSKERAMQPRFRVLGFRHRPAASDRFSDRSVEEGHAIGANRDSVPAPVFEGTKRGALRCSTLPVGRCVICTCSGAEAM